jgi:anthranilate phosphoribosyltransferase
MASLATPIDKLSAGQSLSPMECSSAIAALLDGEVDDADSAAFLTALARKGESPDELDGAIQAIRHRMISWTSPVAAGPSLDTCGTGGDSSDTVNISTAAAIVVAACGTRVVKHGNRAASGASGSSDVLAALGVAIDPEPAVLERCLRELNIAFLFAPRFHPGLARVAAVRRRLPFRTVFNLVGPLCNPARPSHQLIGVSGEDRADLLASVLSRDEHIERAVIVAGSDRLDEVTLQGPTAIRMIERGRIETSVWYPEDFGLDRQSIAGIKVGGPTESAALLRLALEGHRGPVRDYVLANSAGALWVTGGYSLREAMVVAAAALDSGAALRLLTRWAELAPVGSH